MHDPNTVAFEIKYPWRGKPSKFFPKGYRSAFITIWHKDPERRGSDDSCGWFKRAHHGDPKVLEKIIKRIDWDWDRTYKSDGTGKVYFTGYFYPEDDGAGMPNMGVTAIALNLFFIAIGEYYQSDGRTNWNKARSWMQKHLFDIMLFAENPTDSLRDSIVRKWGTDTKREDRIRDMASCIYGWILRCERPWWQHPRWHIHHWRIQCHPLLAFKRWAFSKCTTCGKGFRWNESVWTANWNSTGPLWFRSEQGIHHDGCGHTTCAPTGK